MASTTQIRRLNEYFTLIKEKPELNRSDQAKELGFSKSMLNTFELKATAAGLICRSSSGIFFADDKKDWKPEQMTSAYIGYEADEKTRAIREEEARPHLKSEKLLQDERLQKLLRKRKPTAKDCGIIEVADGCYRMYRRKEGLPESSFYKAVNIQSRLADIYNEGGSIDDYSKIRWIYETASSNYTIASLYERMYVSAAGYLTSFFSSLLVDGSPVKLTDDISAKDCRKKRSDISDLQHLFSNDAKIVRKLEELQNQYQELITDYDGITGFNIELQLISETCGLIGMEVLSIPTARIVRSMKDVNFYVESLIREVEDSEGEYLYTDDELQERKDLAEKIRTAFPEYDMTALDDFPEGSLEQKDYSRKKADAKKLLKKPYRELVQYRNTVFINILWSRGIG